jgi:hypothetical protein
VIPSAVESPPVADRPQARRRSRAGWLILLCYLAGAMLVTFRL